ncbi:kinase-like domain-containing protein [Lipomyces chichibuensis]|uniref:kinase-like domain-containing protein n=1 Tax=Lipomyces chichibuensis TaxID=1546026 RepID=UPI003343B86C
MSIVPYNGDQKQSIVLHDPIRGAVVLLDRDSRQLSLHRDLTLAQPVTDSNDISIVNRPSSSRVNSQSHWFQQATSSSRSRQQASTGHRAQFADSCPYCGRGASTITDQSGSNAFAGQANGLHGRHSPRMVRPDNLDGGVRGGRTFVDRHYFRLLHDASVTSTPTQSPSDMPIFGSSSSSALPDVHAAKSGISSSAYSEGYFERFFVTERELGRGGRGAVYLVEHILDGVSLGQFACKKIPVGNDHKWLERVLREVNLLRLTHTNLVNYNHVWIENAQLTKFGPSVPCVFILQEYCNCGTLEDYVNKRSGLVHRNLTKSELKMRARRLSQWSADCAEEQRKRFLTLEEIGSFYIDITSGLNHLHQHGFVHRDLKPSNCLLNESAGIPGALPRVLVSDFGEGQREGTKRDATGATGTVGYSAPETLLPDVTGELAEFSFKTDMFSMGMILHFLCFARLPYEHDFDNEFDELREEVMRWKGFDKSKVAGIRSDLPSELYDLLSKLLSPVPVERPSAEELLDLIGVNAESRRRKSSGTSSMASSPWSSKGSSPSSTGTSSSIFSLWRSRTSPQPSVPNKPGMTGMPPDPLPSDPIRTIPLLSSTPASAEPSFCPSEDLVRLARPSLFRRSVSVNTSADARQPSDSNDVNEMPAVKPEYAITPVRRTTAAPMNSRPLWQRTHVLFWIWIMSYIIVGVISSYGTLFALRRREGI